MWDLHVPSPEGLTGVLLVGLALYAALMLGMLLLGELSALGHRMPRPALPGRSQLPSLLVGVGLAFLMVVAVQVAHTGRLPPGAASALEQAQKLIAWSGT
jgi:hypothetical protein